MLAGVFTFLLTRRQTSFFLIFTFLQTEEFVAWLADLKDKRAQVRIAARLRQAESGNLGDCSPWRAQPQNCGSTIVARERN